jgi:hypothetical protein
VTLDDNLQYPVVLHEDTPTGKRWLITALGLRGIQSLRSSKRVRPQAHGGINETRYEDGRNITLTGEIMSQVSVEDAFAEWALLAAPMIQTLDDGPALLKWTEGATGNMLQRLVKLDGDLDPPFQDGAAILSYQAQFFSEDPRAYSQTLTTATSTALATAGGGHTFPTKYPRTYASSGGGTVTFVNGGNRPTPPVFQIVGFCQNPQIVFIDAGLRLVFNCTINAGDFLEVDVANRTVKLNGTTNRLNFYDGANSQWYELPRGSSNLQLVAAGFDGNALLKVLGRAAFA